ncbi:response regulator transcription factor [Patescibacteria group bacterium]
MAKILFIEDDPLILKIYSTRLTADGHEVLTAGNGEDGLNLAQQQIPDLIVLDIMMPKMDGFTVLTKLRENAQLQKTPVLVYSNLAREDEMRKAKDMGATESIIKANISPTEMVGKIKRYVQPDQSQSAQTQPVQTQPPQTQQVQQQQQQKQPQEQKQQN